MLTIAHEDRLYLEKYRINASKMFRKAIRDHKEGEEDLSLLTNEELIAQIKQLQKNMIHYVNLWQKVPDEIKDKMFPEQSESVQKIPN